MGNTFVTPQTIARQALLALRENLVIRDLVTNDFENEYKGVGDTVSVRVPPVLEANEFTPGTPVNKQDVKEEKIPVTLAHHVDVSAAIGTKEQTLDLASLNEQVILPMSLALARKIEAAVTKEAALGAACGIGTPGATPASIDIFRYARRDLSKHLAPTGDRSCLWDPEAAAALLALDALRNVNQSGSANALRDGEMGKVFGFSNYESQLIHSHTPGAFTALTDVTATGSKGTKAVTLTSAAGASTAVINVGDQLTIAGKPYVVTKGGTAVAGVVAVEVGPNLDADYVGATVAFVNKSAHVANLAFHKGAVGFVCRPLDKPLGGVESYTANVGGLALRVVMDYDTDNKQSIVSMDTLFGVAIFRPRHIVRVAG